MAKSRRVCIALITDEEDNILMGLRDKEKLWACPGGHAEEGEDPFLAMHRELYEEVGAEAEHAKLVKADWNRKRNLLIYLFKVELKPDQEFTSENDPDGEFSHIEYVDPNVVAEELHVPIEHNVAIKYWMNH